MDTLQKILVSQFDNSLFEKIKNEDKCEILIGFDDNGKVEGIIQLPGINNRRRGDSLLASYLITCSERALKELPRLMVVDKKYYRYPVIRLAFNGFCLKNPCVNTYGCQEYCLNEHPSFNREGIEEDIVVLKKERLEDQSFASKFNTNVAFGATLIAIIFLFIYFSNRSKQ